MQQQFHGKGHDYRAGSPHLKHKALHERLIWRLSEALDSVRLAGLPLTVLEIGAGDGTFSERLLGLGCRVWATEMSRPSLDLLEARFGDNPAFRGIWDEDGSMAVVQGQEFSLVLCISVLHHIPDYFAFIDKAVKDHLSPGGSLIIMQDPLWYPSLGRARHAFSRSAYFCWRMTQGNYAQGLATRWRRLAGIYDESKAEDMAEYHVVRDGINHERLIAILQQRFVDVSFMPYWSTQGAIWQRMGEVLGIHNTFAITASGSLEPGLG